jgi:hypothetical protein
MSAFDEISRFSTLGSDVGRLVGTGVSVGIGLGINVGDAADVGTGEVAGVHAMPIAAINVNAPTTRIKRARAGMRFMTGSWR